LHTYLRSDSHLFCGHWNGSPIEIGFLPTRLRQVPDSDVLHYHDYYEYYVMLEGSAELEVEGQSVPLRADSIVMVEPGGRHRVRFVDPELGARWVIITQRSEPNSKHVAPGING
jgi:mannose-6-phosphate isomerase-like protein (cupin superfamily)